MDVFKESKNTNKQKNRKDFKYTQSQRRFYSHQNQNYSLYDGRSKMWDGKRLMRRLDAGRKLQDNIYTLAQTWSGEKPDKNVK